MPNSSFGAARADQKHGHAFAGICRGQMASNSLCSVRHEGLEFGGGQLELLACRRRLDFLPGFGQVFE